MAYQGVGSYTGNMSLNVDEDAVRRIAQKHAVKRLHVFGSAVTDRFDSERSDVDLLVEFISDTEDPFGAYFGLKEDLERYFERSVDLVVRSAVRNPYFLANVEQHAEEIYAS